jgi:hypothetical protein
MVGSKHCTKLDVNLESSPGKPWLNLGYTSKRAAMESEEFPKNFYHPHTPVWHVTTKKEFLPKEEVLDGKVRTFFIPPVDYVLHQKWLYDGQDLAMKKKCNDFQNFWSRYGFTKQFNGIDLLAHAHTDNQSEHEMGDISGWDRLFPLIPEVYDLRREFLMVDSTTKLDILEMQEHVRRGLETQMICMPNGEIYAKKHGNPSGSGKTTTDNTIGHIIIRFHFWIRFFLKTTGKVPSYDTILRHVIESLYGDDYLSSVSAEIRALRATHFTPETYYDYVVAHYNLYNKMTIKKSAFKMSADIADMEFLGSTFVFNRSVGYYCGEPRWSKCTTTLTKVLDAKTPSSIISTIVALYIISATGSTKGLEFQSFLRTYSAYLNALPEFSADPQSHYLATIALNRFDTNSLLHGLESRLLDVTLIPAESKSS